MYFWLLLQNNIPQRLMTGFVVQGHIKAFQFYKSLYFHMHFLLDILQKLHFANAIFSDRKTRKEGHLI